MKDGLKKILILFVCWGPALNCLAQEDGPALFQDKMLPAIFNVQIQAELELVDDQKLQLKRLLDQVKQQQQQLSEELKSFQQQGASSEELEAKRKEFVDTFAEHKRKAQNEIMEVLLPHQRERLRQLTAQFMLRETAKRNKVPSGILVPEMRQYLEIDDTQAKWIREKAETLQRQLAEKIRKLTEETQAELLRELTDEQRRKYRSLIGEPANAIR